VCLFLLDCFSGPAFARSRNSRSAQTWLSAFASARLEKVWMRTRSSGIRIILNRFASTWAECGAHFGVSLRSANHNLHRRLVFWKSLSRARLFASSSSAPFVKMTESRCGIRRLRKSPRALAVGSARSGQLKKRAVKPKVWNYFKTTK